ncbi:MAG: hypothetical protein U9P81_02250 [Euryarchaeota archaeon]|nr:hypothetical protein [Euryarchaeota archaeon]
MWKQEQWIDMEHIRSESKIFLMRHNNRQDWKYRKTDVVRHNALEELNHRWSRMHIRRRTGRSKTTNEMTKYGALLAVLSNLKNEDYVKTVLGDVNDFVMELQNVTDEELQKARQLIRKFPQHPLVKSDVKRSEILRDFVVLVEDEYNDVPEADISRWLSNFIDTDARMTP